MRHIPSQSSKAIASATIDDIRNRTVEGHRA
jgi:hypothetical protein